MREIFSDEFDELKPKRVHEKVLYQRIAFTVVCILAYLSAMGFTAYAFFTADVTSSSNTIKAATYAMDCTITPKDGEPIEASSISLDGQEVFPKEYKICISIDKQNNTAATGFCVVKVLKNGATEPIVYHTAQIWKEKYEAEGKSQSLTFTLTLNEAATVTFTPHWGTSSHYAEYKESGEDGELYIKAGDMVTVGDLKMPQSKPDEKPDAQKPETQEETKTQQTEIKEETEVQQDEVEEETEEQQVEAEEPATEDTPEGPVVEESVLEDASEESATKDTLGDPVVGVPAE